MFLKLRSQLVLTGVKLVYVNPLTERMPRCEGRPDGPCPDKLVDNTVRNSQGDMMLFTACEIYQFPYLAPSSSGNSVAVTPTMPPTVPIIATAPTPSISSADDDKELGSVGGL